MERYATDPRADHECDQPAQDATDDYKYRRTAGERRDDYPNPGGDHRRDGDIAGKLLHRISILSHRRQAGSRRGAAIGSLG